MIARVSGDGQITLPLELRQDAQLQPGDTLEVQIYKGTIVLRKERRLTPAQCAALLERSRSQPKATAEDEAAVAETIGEVRARRR